MSSTTALTRRAWQRSTRRCSVCRSPTGRPTSWWWLGTTGPRGSRSSWPRTTDRRTGPIRERPQQVHLDVMVDDLAAADREVRRLGARRLTDGQHVYADPAGHPFCLIPRPGWAPPVQPVRRLSGRSRRASCVAPNPRVVRRRRRTTLGSRGQGRGAASAADRVVVHLDRKGRVGAGVVVTSMTGRELRQRRNDRQQRHDEHAEGGCPGDRELSDVHGSRVRRESVK